MKRGTVRSSVGAIVFLVVLSGVILLSTAFGSSFTKVGVEVLTDPEIKSEMWYDGLANHFSGPEDPDYCVLRFKTKRYNLLVDWKEARGEL